MWTGLCFAVRIASQSGRLTHERKRGVNTFAGKTITTMSDGEFDALVEQFIERGEDRMALPTFLQVMADLAEQRATQE